MGKVRVFKVSGEFRLDEADGAFVLPAEQILQAGLDGEWGLDGLDELKFEEQTGE